VRKREITIEDLCSVRLLELEIKSRTFVRDSEGWSCDSKHRKIRKKEEES